MSRDDLLKGRFSEPGRAYHVTTVIEGRRPVFADLTLGRILVEEMRLLDRAGAVRSLAFVVMPDHLHWLFVLGDGADLSSVMRRSKRRSARRLGQVGGVVAPVWQRGFYDHAVRREETLRDIGRYIVANPLRRGLVQSVGDYALWDAVWVGGDVGDILV
ncbi:REP-associated tyrosine transposase [Thiocapsa rosea]|uniref:REP element-mobilizing transposase RayT n=1 Tax=Thiocapsa rosea TaxID=69360 RepID=A0A495VA16_9GAMM|nr:transposase [Thiocapsa rosea]RKT45590.1 REP element-mobilizing transposase RayT [Thiocapsa rosea]